jgi:hypothetical protein
MAERRARHTRRARIIPLLMREKISHHKRKGSRDLFRRKGAWNLFPRRDR